MKLIVGLGNPGKEYKNTRHNSGFLAIEKLAKDLGVEFKTKKWNALVVKTKIEGTPVLLMKPQTYMNESGYPVGKAVAYYDIDVDDVLVIHDDMDLVTGSVRIRDKGTSAGQKGMKSIMDALGTTEIDRIRIGVGHSEVGNHDIVPDWVLSPIPKEEKKIFKNAIDTASKAAYAWVSEDIHDVMNQYTVRIKKSEGE